MSPDMKTFADTYLRRKGATGRSLIDVHNAINHPSTGMSYRANTHCSAEGAFSAGEANFLSYSALFIAMSRYVNLRLSFQEVDLPPSWNLGEKDLLLRFRHVKIIATLATVRKKIVCFRMDSFRNFYLSREISDHEVLALQFNNLAVDTMFEDDWSRVFKNLHSSIKADPKKVVSWGNLGWSYGALTV